MDEGLAEEARAGLRRMRRELTGARDPHELQRLHRRASDRIGEMARRYRLEREGLDQAIRIAEASSNRTEDDLLYNIRNFSGDASMGLASSLRSVQDSRFEAMREMHREMELVERQEGELRRASRDIDELCMQKRRQFDRCGEQYARRD